MKCKRVCAVNVHMLPVKATYFFTLAGVASLLPYLAVFMKQLGLTASETAIVYGTMPFLGAVVRPVLGGIADKLQKHKLVLMLCCVLTGVFHGCLLFVPAVDKGAAGLQNTSTVHLSCDQNASLLHHCSPVSPSSSVCIKDNGDPQNNQSSNASHNSSECTLTCRSPLRTESRGNTLHLFGVMEIVMLTTSDPHNSSAKYTTDSYGQASTGGVVLHVSGLASSHSQSHKYLFNDKTSKCHMYELTSFQYKDKSYQALNCPSGISVKCQLQCVSFPAQFNPQCKTDTGKTVKLFGYTFWVFFVINCLANIAFAPIFSLIDALVYSYLGEQRNKWGQQRMWGTIGFAIMGIISGLVMDVYSGGEAQVNYTVAFSCFAALHVVAGIAACTYAVSDDVMCGQMTKNIGQLMRRIEVLAFLGVVLSFGMLYGVIEAFLFWHLYNLGGTPLLLGLCMGMNCLPEIPILFVASFILDRIGQITCLYIVCCAYAIRFLVYSFIQNPWVVLAVEPIHGITFGLMYAAASSYASMITPPGMHGTIQGIIGSLHFGFGRGSGGLIGGLIMAAYGAVVMFRGCAVFVMVVFVSYLSLQLILRRRQPKKKQQPGLDQKAEQEKMLAAGTRLSGSGDQNTSTAAESDKVASPEQEQPTTQV